MKKITLLGSTGSIGTQTLKVVDRNSDKFAVTGITGNRNIELLENQIRKYKPSKAAIADEALFKSLKNNISDTDTKLYAGTDGLCEVAAYTGADIAVSSIMGIAGLLPTIAAINQGIDIALANKETLVTAGRLITNLCKEKNVKLLPVDSEHSAIFQCLNSDNSNFLKKIILTASGGPFYGKKIIDLKNITPAQALKHPNWSMGRKITIDSATLMNKGLEVIEAKWLFGVEVSDIEVVVHRESIIHSMVQFTDNSVLAQLGLPDMCGPISYALNYPNREKCIVGDELDLTKIASLTFGKPDEETFKCLALAKKAISIGGTMPAFMNGANEAVVEMFLNEEIGFCEIGETIEKAMDIYIPKYEYNLDDVVNADVESRNIVNKLIRG